MGWLNFFGYAALAIAVVALVAATGPGAAIVAATGLVAAKGTALGIALAGTFVFAAR